MKATKNQLADPKWWDENAPKRAYFAWVNKLNEECFAWSESAWFGCNWWAANGNIYPAFFNPNAWRMIGKRPTQPQWAESGLPPAGTECEISNVGKSFEWCKIKYMGESLCVVDHKNYKDQHYCLSSVSFRPLRTQAEIERDDAVNQMIDSCKSPELPSTWNACGNLYDAGYRKPMTREDFVRAALPAIQMSIKGGSGAKSEPIIDDDDAAFLLQAIYPKIFPGVR